MNELQHWFLEHASEELIHAAAAEAVARAHEAPELMWIESHPPEAFSSRAPRRAGVGDGPDAPARPRRQPGDMHTDGKEG